jgi:phosphatidylglycerol:prolipoprotein diacylglycerol transferase
MMAPFVHHPFEFDLGPLHVTGFGIAVALAFATAQFTAQQELIRRGEDPAPMERVLVAALAGFIVGAKLYFVALHPGWASLFSRSGLVFWGGLMGGVLACWIALRAKRIPFLQIADACAPALAAGYAIGRTGCWAIGDDYGRPSSGPLAVAFPHGYPPSTVANVAQDAAASVPAGMLPGDVLAVHPTQLYEVAMGLVMFAILWHYRRHQRARGWLFGLYCALAGVERFIVEFYRAKDDRFLGPLSTAQVIAIAFVAVGAVLMTKHRRRVIGSVALLLLPAACIML